MEKNHRILIVDDNEAIHKDIKSILHDSTMLDDEETQALEDELFSDEEDEAAETNEAIEYTIDDAFQGKDAIRMVEKAGSEGHPYSMAFMDVRMPPGLDGIQTIQQIWQHHPDVEMVICTAYSDYSWNEIMSNFGKTDRLLFLKKPFDTTALKQITLTLTTKWDLRREAAYYINNLEAEVQKRTTELNKMIVDLVAARDDAEKHIEKLQHENKQHVKVIESLNSVLIGVDRFNRVTHWNRLAEKVFTLRAEEVLDQPLDKAQIQWDWKEMQGAISACKTSSQARQVEIVNLGTPDGSNLVLQVAPIYTDEDNDAGVIIVAQLPAA